MPCAGICARYRSPKPNGLGRYEAGQKHCTACELFINWDGIRCPCCRSTLRTKPRKLRNKKRLQHILESVAL